MVRFCPVLRLHVIRKMTRETDSGRFQKQREIMISIPYPSFGNEWQASPYTFLKSELPGSKGTLRSSFAFVFKLVSSHCACLSLKASVLFASCKMTDGKKRNNEINGELQHTLAVK